MVYLLLQIKFERSSQADGETKSKIITRNLYHRLNPLPQKKVMTFNRKPNDFHFNSSYGDLSFLNEELQRYYFFTIPNDSYAAMISPIWVLSRLKIVKF